jgi:cysteine desulfurase
LENRIYFDNAATTSLEPKVLEAMLPYFTEHFGNPSSIYSYGRDTRAGIETARKTIAKILNAQTSEIIFTSGGTEANNMAIKGAVNYLEVKTIISSKIEHHCILHTLEYLEKYQQIKIEYVKLDNKGKVDIEHLEFLLNQSKEKTLVTLMHANNELGNLLPIEKVAQLCTQYQAYFHSDTVQTFGHLPIDTQALNVDFLSGSAHKFHGPKGVGFLYMRKKSKVQSFIHGGGQERGYRAGTENVYGIIGLAKAAEIAYKNLDNDKQYILDLKNYFIQKLNLHFADIQIIGDIENSLYTVLNVSFPANDKAFMLLFNLDLKGICASGGSACSSGAASGSHVINTIMPNSDRINIRFSFSKYNTKAEIDSVIQILMQELL